MTASRTFVSPLLSLVWLCGALALAACTAGGASSSAGHEPEGTPSDPVKTCAKEGQTCVFSEGKLGVCTQKLDPGGGSESARRYVCMSLH